MSSTESEVSNSGVKTEIMDITPAMAMRILEKNTRNRRKSANAVKRYAELMKKGKWQLNGDAIRIADDGTLLDGQHRLQAVLETGLTVPMMIVTGLPFETFTTIDVGRKRTGGDVIGIYDESLQKHQTIIAAALRIICSFTPAGVWIGQEMKWGRFDHGSMLAALKKHKGIVRSTEYAFSLSYARKIMPLACIAALHYLFSKESVNEAEDFFYKLDTGVGLSLHHPVTHLRRRLFDMHESKSRTLTVNVLPYVVKAWELLREGREVTVFRVDDDYVPTIK